jgi:hypothetical protein
VETKAEYAKREKARKNGKTDNRGLLQSLL